MIDSYLCKNKRFFQQFKGIWTLDHVYHYLKGYNIIKKLNSITMLVLISFLWLLEYSSYHRYEVMITTYNSANISHSISIIATHWNILNNTAL